MITFTKDQNRLINFNQAKLKLDNLELFNAVNAIDHYSHFESIDRKNNYHTDQYIDQWKWLPGKLGCNLSYVKLLKDYHRNYNFYPDFPSWLLVIEDDVEIKIEDATSVFSSILNKASDLSFDFVKFFITTGKENINGKIIEFSPELQFDESRHISDGFYKLMPSWGTAAQAFHINSVSKILKQLPWNDHIDQILMRPPLFDSLNSAAYKQDFLNYCGAKSLEEADEGYGSLIFNNSTDGKVDWRKLTRI
jgi:GR25 family glycosyltransferase involved in LPS biosynthesis